MMRGVGLVVAVLVLFAATAPVGAQSAPAALADIDAYWARAFAAAGFDYASPGVVAVEGPTATGCGVVDPAFGPGGYCTADQTIYFAPLWLGDPETGGAVFVVVLAHEWGHHVQLLLGVGDPAIAEPQADCLAGAYVEDADDRGVLSPGAVAEALRLINSTGDVPWGSTEGLPHGPGTIRSSAFMIGQLRGLSACGVGL